MESTHTITDVSSSQMRDATFGYSYPEHSAHTKAYLDASKAFNDSLALSARHGIPSTEAYHIAKSFGDFVYAKTFADMMANTALSSKTESVSKTEAVEPKTWSSVAGAVGPTVLAPVSTEAVDNANDSDEAVSETEVVPTVPEQPWTVVESKKPKKSKKSKKSKKTEPKPKAETKPKTKSESKAEPKSEPKSEPTTDEQTDAEPQKRLITWRRYIDPDLVWRFETSGYADRDEHMIVKAKDHGYRTKRDNVRFRWNSNSGMISLESDSKEDLTYHVNWLREIFDALGFN
jgi:hypothetical protein